MLTISISQLTLVSQETEKANKWSVSLGYYPFYDFNLSNQVASANDAFYWHSVSGRISYKLSDKFSILSGLSTRKNKIDLQYDLFPNAYVTEVFLELPFQLNYHFPKHSDYFLPYFKMAIINSYLKSSVNEPISDKHSYYNILSDMGLGTDFKLNNKLSVISEISIGYFLKYQYSNRAYLNGFFGLQYKF